MAFSKLGYLGYKEYFFLDQLKFFKKKLRYINNNNNNNIKIYNIYKL